MDSHRNPYIPMWISHMGIHISTGSYMDSNRNPCFLYGFITWESMYPQVPTWIPIGIHIFLCEFLTWESMYPQVPIWTPTGIHASYMDLCTRRFLYGFPQESELPIWISHMGIHVSTGSYIDSHRNPYIPMWISHMGIHVSTGSYMDSHTFPCGFPHKSTWIFLIGLSELQDKNFWNGKQWDEDKGGSIISRFLSLVADISN